MKKDYQGLALERRRFRGWKISEVVELVARSEDEEAVVKSKDGLRKVPVFISGCGRLAGIHSTKVEVWDHPAAIRSSLVLLTCGRKLRF
jgi:hypothetical protein